MQTKAFIQSLLAILLWSTLAYLGLSLSRMPPFLLVLGMGPMGAAFFLWDAALKNGDPRIIGSLAYLTPMLSTLLLIVTGSGAFGRVTGIAMVLIVGGAALGSLPAAGRASMRCNNG